MRGRCFETVDPRVPTMLRRSTSGFHRPGTGEGIADTREGEGKKKEGVGGGSKREGRTRCNEKGGEWY